MPHRIAGYAGQTIQFETVIGRDHLDLVAAPADPLEPYGIGEDLLDHPVVIDRLVVKQREPLDPRGLRQLDRDDIARMAPILLDRHRVAQRIHCIEDQQVGVSVELDERVGFVEWEYLCSQSVE